MNVGFIGLGKMGAHMARNIQAAGHALTVHDLHQAAAAPLLENGAAWAATPAEAAAASQVVFTSLPGPREVEAVGTGPDGIADGAAKGSVWVDTSTNAPSVVRRLAAALEAKGIALVDAPVSGGPMGAEAASLAVMVGASPEAYATALPLLQAIGKAITHVGGPGAGSVAKLVHNSISMATRIAVQEGMVLATKAGVDPDVMLEVLKSGSFGQQLILTRHIPELVFAGDFDHPRFSLTLSEKDVRLAIELGREEGVELGMAAYTLEEIHRGQERGWGEQDNLVTFKLAEERAGVQVRTGKRA